jgi:hypothetical protein
MEEQQTTTGTQQDNSDLSIDERVSMALDEPESNPVEPQYGQEEEPPQQEALKEQDNTYNECPDKFRDKNGKVDVNKLAKSYKELEPLLQEKATWEKERAELLKAKETLDKQREQYEQSAIDRGYSSAQDMEMAQALISLEANEYAKYLHLTDDPEEVRSMLIAYLSNPTEEALDDIELEFPSSVIKKVAIAREKQESAWRTQLEVQQQTQAYAGIEDVIKRSVDYDSDIFNHKPFEDLFTRTIQRYGNNFTFEDAQVLIGAVNDLRKAIRDEVVKEYGLQQENKKATDELASVSPNSAPAPSQGIMNLQGAELAKAISKLI